jgi:hypothetical protein
VHQEISAVEQAVVGVYLKLRSVSEAAQFGGTCSDTKSSHIVVAEVMLKRIASAQETLGQADCK